MSSVFDVLPGIEVSPGVISKSLAEMWVTAAARGGAAPAEDDGRAMQVNLVLHLGFNTTSSDAVEQFQIAVRFSRRYPCRVVVLCPLPLADGGTEIRAKIYGECHLGKSKGDTRCCEFVILSYPPSVRQYLENQVSVCLSTDLPLYYWAHRFSSSARLSDYQYLLRRSQRVLFDSAIVPEDAFRHPWPKPEVVRDLAHARLLPVRQAIGQFLSGYSPAVLADGLTAVRVRCHPAVCAEGRVLAQWVRERMANCGADGAEYSETSDNTLPARGFELRFDYNGPRHFVYRGDLAARAGEVDADFGTGAVRLPASAGLLAPEAALGEAMFF